MRIKLPTAVKFLTYIVLIVWALSSSIGCTPVNFGPISLQATQAPSEQESGDAAESEPDVISEIVEGGDSIIIIEEIVIILLFIAALVGIASRKLRVPYTLGLVVIGLVLTLSPQIDISIRPSLIFGLLVPPLVFEAAFHLNFRNLRRNLVTILTFAVPGVILAMAVVGGLVSWWTGIPFVHALVFGAIVAAIDPVAVIALFRNLGVPKRLEVMLEGESLFNDGTSIVLFGLVISIAVSGEQFNVLSGVIDFIRIAGGGIVVGLILGTLASQIIIRIDDYLIEITLTTVLAYGSYLVAEEAFHVSGVLAVVGAGLTSGNIGPRGMSPTTRNVLFNFWEYVAFLANSFIFLLIGLQIELASIISSWQVIIIAIIAVLIARALTIYGLAWVVRDIPLRWQHALNWGGLRGAISLALALSLPLTLGNVRSQLQVMTFGVVLFTLLVQGTTIGSLVRRLGITERSEVKQEYERRLGRSIANQASYDHLKNMRENGMISEHTWQTIRPLLEQYNQVLTDATKDILTNHPELEAEEREASRREALQAQRSTLGMLQQDGIIGEETYIQLVAEVDAALTHDTIKWPQMMRFQEGIHPPIDRLLSAIIQEQDLENALSSLSKLGYPVTNLPSSGGYLGRRNITLLVGFSKGEEKQVFEAISMSCKERVEYLSTPMEAGPLPFPNPVPVNVGGATIFVFEVEKYEEI